MRYRAPQGFWLGGLRWGFAEEGDGRLLVESACSWRIGLLPNGAGAGVPAGCPCQQRKGFPVEVENGELA